MLAPIIAVLMLFGSVSSKCPDNFSPWYDDVCGYAARGYLYIYPDALHTCLNFGSELPSIHSDAENANLRSAVTNAVLGADYSFWIGLNCTGNFQFSWLDGSPFDYINLYSSENLVSCSPDYPHVMLANSESAKWSWNNYTSAAGVGVTAGAGVAGVHYAPETDTVACTISTKFDSLCNDHLVSGTAKCLQIDSAQVTGTNAELSCSFSDGHLISVHSEEENSFLRRTAIANGFANGMHLGMVYSPSKAPSWTWTDGSAVNYTNYAGGSPNNSTGNCTKMNVDGTWITIDCNTKLPFICELSGIEVQKPGCSAKKSYVKDDHLYSPSYPLRVEAGECEYSVKASSLNKKVALRVESFNIHMCCHHLHIYEGSEGSNLLKKLSGHVAPGTIITSTGPEMRIVWNAKEEGKIHGWHFTVLEV